MSTEKVKILNTRPSLYPVPVTLVTCSSDSIDNIITISWTGILCSKPPTVYISVRPKRYSYQLIYDSRKYVINIPSADLLPIADKCGNISGKNVDKFETYKLSKIFLEDDFPPCIKECSHHLFCEVIEIHKYGTHHAFIGKVVSEYINSDCIDENAFDYTKIKPIAYCRKDYMFLTDKVGYYGGFKV